MAIDNLPLWHASLRHPAGNIPLPEVEPWMYTYICEMFVCFGLYRTSTFSQSAKYVDTGSRPDPVVEVRAQSEHCSSRGVLSKSFFGGSG